nr:zinc finger, RING/FYVE/PHD-type [Tanacetum cinerariifolium]
MTLQDPTWNIDTAASSYLNSNSNNLSTLFNTRLFPKRKQRDIKQQKIETVQRNHNNGIEIIDLDDSPITSKRKQRDIKQQKIVTVQRNHNNGIELIDLDDSPIASSRVRDIPDAE